MVTLSFEAAPPGQCELAQVSPFMKQFSTLPLGFSTVAFIVHGLRLHIQKRASCRQASQQDKDVKAVEWLSGKVCSPVLLCCVFS